MSTLILILLLYMYTLLDSTSEYSFLSQCPMHISNNHSHGNAARHSDPTEHYDDDDDDDNTCVGEDCPDAASNEDASSIAIPNHISGEGRGFRAVKIINPYETYLTSHKNSTPICLKCAACLALAENINRIVLQDVDRSISPDEERKNLLRCLRNLCNTGFANYDLRNYEGYGIVSEVSPKSSHMHSSLDGKWTTKLRSMCRLYMDHLDPEVFELIRSGQVEATNYFCRLH